MSDSDFFFDVIKQKKNVNKNIIKKKCSIQAFLSKNADHEKVVRN